MPDRTDFEFFILLFPLQYFPPHAHSSSHQERSVLPLPALCGAAALYCSAHRRI